MSKSGARILVVDDEREILHALQRNLTAHGYEVFTAESGKQALEEIAIHRPDLLLLDLGLPGMSGLDVCRSVRAESSLPIVVHAAQGSGGRQGAGARVFEPMTTWPSPLA